MVVKQKKEKDPQAPKQPFSAFIMFSMSRRNEMKENNLRKLYADIIE